MNQEITAIILCGGKSSRMGTDKGLLTIDNKKLINKHIDELKTVASEIIISSNNPEYCKLFSERLIADEKKDIGPIGGIYSGLKASETDLNFFVTCDSPLITNKLFTILLENFQPGDTIILPSHNNQLEPLLGIYSKQIIKNLEHYIHEKNYSLYKYALANNARIVELNQSFLNTDYYFINLNTREDYKNFKAQQRKTNYSEKK